MIWGQPPPPGAERNGNMRYSAVFSPRRPVASASVAVSLTHLRKHANVARLWRQTVRANGTPMAEL